MIRTIALNVNALTVRNLNAYDHLISYGPRIQCVRWKRKPIWLPTAKSKMFRVPERKFIPIEEQLELKRLHNHYRTLMKSIKYFFVEREQKKSVVDEDAAKLNIQKDFEISSYINDKWNRQVAALREERLIEEREQREEAIAMKLKEKQQRDLSIQEAINAEIKKTKEEFSTFITADNIDKAIDNAVENIVDPNFAIDENGNYYKGKIISYGKPFHKIDLS